jgi:uncharacterized protein involved in exopolysaccharide biosynthesis
MQEEINKANEISIKQLFNIILNSKRRIAIITVLVAALGVVYALILPVQFVSSAKVLPEIAQSGGAKLFGGISSLAGLAGLDIDNLGNTDAVRPNLYPDIVNSTPFAIHILNKPVVTQDGEQFQSLGHFLNKQGKNNGAAKFFSSIFSIFSSKKAGGGAYEKLVENPGNKPFKFTKSQELTLKDFKSRVVSSIDKKTGVIGLSVQMEDPEVAGLIAKESLDYLTEYVVEYRTEKLKKYEQFLNERMSEAKKKYENTRYNLSNYKDRNKNIILLVPKTEEDQLKYDFDMAYGLYLEVSKKLEQTRIQAQNETPVLKTLEPPTIPLMKSEPKRTTIVISFAVMGFILASFLSLYKGIDWKSLDF